jgi:hypothetical protein
VNPSQEPAPPSYEQAYQQQAYEPSPAYPFGTPDELTGWEPPLPRRRPLRRNVLVALAVTAALAVAGAPLGLFWAWLAPSVPVINAGRSGIVDRDPSPEGAIAADGWFTLLGFGFGLLAAVLIWLVLRRDRGPALLLGVAFGGIACALVAWQVGRLPGLSAWQEWRASSSPGAIYERPPDLRAHGPLLVIAFAAVIVTTLLAGWSNDPDLERRGARPGYGHDLREPSSGSPDGPDPTAAPAPHAPWPAEPPRD